MGALIVLLIIIGLLVLIAIGIYNSLVVLRNRCDNAWAQVDVQLRRRYDLIPNLVETVKGYAKHEREVFEKVTRPGPGPSTPRPSRSRDRPRTC